MRVRTSGLPIFLIVTLFGLGCDGPGFGWPGTDDIDADVVRIQELAAGRVAAGEAPPKGPAELAAAVPTTPPPAATEPEPEPEPEPLVPDAERGAEIYALNCSSCHGASGHGDGPAGAALDPTPSNHADGGYMNTLDNERLYKAVYEGGAAVGKSPTMAPWGAVLGEAKVWDLVAFMRTLAEPAYEGSVP
ncbi:MAG: cytochrome c [Deltaproteobacteria bacterium]|nr:cytochrome c [Deltaproteobacteria bacterium]